MYNFVFHTALRAFVKFTLKTTNAGKQKQLSHVKYDSILSQSLSFAMIIRCFSPSLPAHCR